MISQLQIIMPTKKRLLHSALPFCLLLLLTILIPLSLVNASHNASHNYDSASDPTYGNGYTNCGNKTCGGSSSCSGGDSAGASNEGAACTGPANACGARNNGVINGGVCTTRIQTGTGSKGSPIYTYYAVTTPANPANYGVACTSAANACGTKTSGTINCSGVCSASTAPANPAGYGVTCMATNACGVTVTGAKTSCSTACSQPLTAPTTVTTQVRTGTTGKGQPIYTTVTTTVPATDTCALSCSVTTPPLPAGYGTACTSPANVCGARTNGTIACTGSCSATSAPALPAGYGTACQSAANNCGIKASGVIQCSGSCSASTPSNNLCAPDATVTLKANPKLVQKDNSSTIVWTSTNAASCTLTGTNGDSWSGTSGTRTSGAIPDKTTFTLTCTGINTKTTTESIVVDIVPKFREI